MSKSNRKRILQHTELRALKQVFLTLDSLKNSKGRFEHYRYLRAIHAVHDAWTKNNFLPERISFLATIAGLNDNPIIHPIRILIDATHPTVDRRTASLWTRVLIFAFRWDVKTDQLVKFIRSRRGIARCARWAALGNRLPKRDDWVEDFERPLRGIVAIFAA